MSRKGFTIIELLICIVILGIFVTMVSTSAGRFDEDVKIAAALKEMKTIQTALVEGVYPDLGYIPCGIDAASTDERRTLEALFVPAYLFMERSEVREKLGALDCLKEGYVSEYEKYQSAGWRGPYMKYPRGMIDATYFDPSGFPETGDSHVYLDALTTPWADDCEEMALEAEEAGDPDLALEYRQGKYYQVFYPQMTQTSPVWEDDAGYIVEWEAPVCEIPRDSGYIVCRGPDCLPPEAPGADVAAYLKCMAQIKENAVSEKECAEINNRGYAVYGSVAGFRDCVKKRCENAYPECYGDEDSVPLDQRLAVTDSGNKYYMDIGDDLVMSLSGKVIRGPLND